MAWLALTLELESAALEAFSEALLEAGAQSVWLGPGELCAVLQAHEDPAALVQGAARAFGVRAPAFRTERLEERDWVRASQAQFTPLTIGERLWIGPSWCEPPAGRLAVRIDPGLAFGTGSHPSTKLVLGFLDETLQGGESLLDYGCGSGILAISAAKLGAARVHAVDLDPQALATTRANAAANGVAVRAMLPDELGAGHYDVAVANILAQPLVVLAPLIAKRARRIALSGILEAQAGEVARAYAPAFEMKVSACEEGWALLAGVRK